MAIREENGDFDHYFLAGQYMRRGFESRDLLRPGDPRGASIGFMKTDRLLDGSLDRGSVLASLGLRGDRPIVLYAPTGAKGNSLETFGADLVKMLAAEDAYDVVVKLHDHPRGWVDWFEQLEVMEGQHVRIARTPDIVPILYAADLLVTDASSVSNEYALLDRPIVFLDVPLLFDEVRARGAMLDLDLRKGGRIAVDANDAMLAVKEELARPARLSVERQAIAADLFYNPGRATDEALAWVGSELT
jgi:CDP-glycerol glycerophosphotransferase (TagB/SpsB family)